VDKVRWPSILRENGAKEGFCPHPGNAARIHRRRAGYYAKEIVEHLKLSNRTIEPGRPLGGHGQGIIPKLDEGDGE